jgi:hypothetical protein
VGIVVLVSEPSGEGRTALTLISPAGRRFALLLGRHHVTVRRCGGESDSQGGHAGRSERLAHGGASRATRHAPAPPGSRLAPRTSWRAHPPAYPGRPRVLRVERWRGDRDRGGRERREAMGAHHDAGGGGSFSPATSLPRACPDASMRPRRSAPDATRIRIPRDSGAVRPEQPVPIASAGVQDPPGLAKIEYRRARLPASPWRLPPAGT